MQTTQSNVNNLPGTKRWCERCNRITRWEYNPVASGVGHSYCTKCGAFKEPAIDLGGQVVSDLKEIINQKNRKITELEKELADLKKEMAIISIKNAI